MSALIVVALVMVAAAGTATVATQEPDRQAVSLGVFGATLVVLFVILQAPDVALSEVGIGTTITPLIVMLALRTTRKDAAESRARRTEGDES